MVNEMYQKLKEKCFYEKIKITIKFNRSLRFKVVHGDLTTARHS